MKKVCHITNAHQRYDLRILKKECVSLANHGYDVKLLVQDGKKDELFENVKIISTGVEPKSRKDRIKHLDKLLKLAIDCDAEIYHLHDPELLLLGLKLKKYNKCVVFDSHEDVPVQIADKPYIPKFFRPIISKVYRILESKILVKYDGLITVTPHIASRLKNINKNVEVITNYPIIESEKVQYTQKRLDSELKLCFAGGISEQWNIDVIVKAIEDIENVSLTLAGTMSAAYFEYLKGLKAWDKVNYLGEVTHSEVKRIYKESDVGCALNYSLQLKNNGSLGNTKLFEFMASKLPVICTNYPIWDALISNNKCGISVEPRSVEAVRTAILKLKEDKILREEMGINGEKAILKEFNWGTQERKLLDFYMEL